MVALFTSQRKEIFLQHLCELLRAAVTEKSLQKGIWGKFQPFGDKPEN